MGNKLIPLSMWAERRYGAKVPSKRTLRRWAVSGNIQPPPKKEGRGYWVREHAEYIDFTSPDHIEDLARVLDGQATQ